MSVVVGFTTSDYLMLDIDGHTKIRTIDWAKRYSKRYQLGNALIMMTSDNHQLDLFGNRLYNFSIIFGARLPWQEIMLHIFNAFEDKMVERKFVKMRFQGFITERIGEKNAKVRPPEIFRFIYNGDRKKDREGIMEYLRWWKWYRDICPALLKSKQRELTEELSPDEDVANPENGLKMFDDSEDLEVEEYDPIDFETRQGTPTGDRWIDMMYREAYKLSKKKKQDYAA